MPRAQGTVATQPTTVSDHNELGLKYIRDLCADLEGAIDREALLMLCAAGIFAVDDPTKLIEAVDRLRGVDEPKENRDALTFETRVQEGKTPKARAEALNALDELRVRQLNDSIEAAYLLGIAVGRRLGPQSLQAMKVGAK